MSAGGIPDWKIIGLVSHLAKGEGVRPKDAAWARDRLVEAFDGKGLFPSPYRSRPPPPGLVESFLPLFALKGKLELGLGRWRRRHI